MAGNMPQMAGVGRGGVPRPAHAQLSQLIYTTLMQNPVPSINSWHSNVNIAVRISNAMNMISNAFLAMPQLDSQQLISSGINFEREVFQNSPDKNTYDQRIAGRIADLFRKRQANEQNLQNTLNAQQAAAAQAQAQMMMNQQSALQAQMGRGMSQPRQPGFQHLQQQMQASPIPPQAQQTQMGIPNSGPPTMNPNQQAMQMRAQQAPQLSPQDKAKISQQAMAKFGSAPEAEKAQIRMRLQGSMPAQQWQRYQQLGQDPVLMFYQQQYLQHHYKQMMGSANQGLMPQRTMNAAVPPQMAATPNGELGPFSNAEIMNQQKAGLMAQEAGQMVVPVSGGVNRNPTPQPTNQQGPGQTQGQMPRPPHMQQQFNIQQAQQLKMDQAAAQSQAQIRAQAQAKQMQGQPGGLSGPGAISQSPAMNTLNAPVSRPPIAMGQQPQVNPGAGPFGQMLDPRFNQPNQRPPMAGAPNMRQQMFNAMLSQLAPDARQTLLSMPPDKQNEMLMKWRQSNAAARMQPQQPSQGNPMAQFAQANMGSQQVNGGMQMTPQVKQMLMQQQLSRMRANGQAQPQIDAQTAGTVMDAMEVPPRLIASISSQIAPVPGEIKKWGQLKAWMHQSGMPQAQQQGILAAQRNHFLAMMRQQAGMQAFQGGQAFGPQSSGGPGQPQPQAINANVNNAATMFAAASTVTPQEMQQARNNDRFKGVPDDRLRMMLIQIKQQNLRARLGMQNPAQPQAQPQVQLPFSQPAQSSQPAAAMTVPVSAAQPPMNHVIPRPQPSPANKQQPSNVPTPQQRISPALPQKNGLKRPSVANDDVVEVPDTSATPVQRPLSQQSQPQPQTQPQAQAHAGFSQAHLAKLTPEQRARFDQLVKSRQGQQGQAHQQSAGMVEAGRRLQVLMREEAQLASQEVLQDVPMNPEQHSEMTLKLQRILAESAKAGKALQMWYNLIRDEGRARLFFKMRQQFHRQFKDAEQKVPREVFSVQPSDIDRMQALIASIGKDLAASRQQNARRAGNQPQPQQQTPDTAATTAAQSAPLNAANLERNSKIHQKSNSKSGQPPAAPTAMNPPFPLGAHSPHGNPAYIGKPAVTQENLHLPAHPRKKAKVGAHPSPQVGKQPSPEMQKRTPMQETKVPTPKLQFRCPESNCESNAVGFATEEACQVHFNNEHRKPHEDPIKFATESLAVSLGLNPDGSAPKAKQPSSQQPSATPMSRGPSKRKREGTPSLKALDMAKTPPNQGGVVKTERRTTTPPQAQPDNLWATVDPQDLFSNLGVPEPGGDGAISDMTVYRCISPKDTPESSKDSASSEPVSDVSEGVALNVNLDMGFDTWHPFDGDKLVNLGAKDVDVDLFETGDLTAMGNPVLGDFTWDEVQNDFDKPFSFDSTGYYLDTSFL